MIIAIQVITLCSTVYAQDNQTTKPNITATTIGTDTVFIMNRAYAEFVAERFDSLQAIKQAFSDCDKSVTMLQSSVTLRDAKMYEQTQLIDNLKSEIMLKNDVVESYKRSQLAVDSLQKQLKTETRKRKTWFVVAIGMGVGAVGGILYGALK